MSSDNQNNKYDLNVLQEEDEFEEFKSEDWTLSKEDIDSKNIWDENWDVDNLEDEFSKQLKAELEKMSYKPATANQN